MELSKEALVAFLIKYKNIEIICKPIVETKHFQVKYMVMDIGVSMPLDQEELMKIAENKEIAQMVSTWYLKEIFRVREQKLKSVALEVKMIIKVAKFMLGFIEGIVESLGEMCIKNNVYKESIIIELDRGGEGKSRLDSVKYIEDHGFKVVQDHVGDTRHLNQGEMEIIMINQEDFAQKIEAYEGYEHEMIIRGIKYFNQWISFQQKYPVGCYQIELEAFDE